MNWELRLPATRWSLSFRRKSARLLAALLLPTLALCLALTNPAIPKDKPKPWETKDWTQWTSADCLYVLNGSPWVIQTYEDIPDAGPLRHYRMSIVQLRSALPLRQALLRQMQLQKHYDEMNGREKQKFDELHTADLPGAERGNVIVVIRNGSVEPLQPLDPYPTTPSKDAGPRADQASRSTFTWLSSSSDPGRKIRLSLHPNK